MNQLELRSYGKINLGLDVVERREDGYHSVKMIMQTVGVYDVLTLSKREEDEIRMSCNLSFLPIDRKNLVFRAVEIMKERYHIHEGVEINLEKHIPVAAGMAGGSSNCAAALKGMNQLFDLGLRDEELCEIGVSLGADVPYCVMGGTALSEGIGEVLTKLPDMPSCHIVIAKPGISVSTKYVYQHLQLDTITKHPDIDGMIKEIEANNLYGICDKLENILETVTQEDYPVILKMKKRLKSRGAIGALMSGSGPTVFGIFDDLQRAKDGLKDIRRMRSVKQSYLVKPISSEDC